MTCKYNRTQFLIFLISTLLSTFLSAQNQIQDSILDNQQKKDIDVAYGAQPAWMVTGAISNVSGSLLQYPFTSHYTNRLFGRIPGLSVTAHNAEPGNEYTSLYSRGINTFGVGQANMLILVDGVEANFADLVPEEVESISLLKDASATAMYGSRGANGVLLVNTKRGINGKLKVVFSTQHGLQSAETLPKFLGSYDYARLYNEGLRNDGKPEVYTTEDLSSYQSGSDPFFHPDVNWYNEVLRKSAPASNYNLNFSGGNNTVRYFVLLNHLTTNNLYRKTGDESDFSINGSYKRVNFRSNVDINLSKRLSAFINFGGTVVDRANPASSTTDEIFNAISIIPPNAFPVYNPNNTIGRNQLYSNPLGDILYKGFYTSNGRTLLATGGLTEELDFITQGLSITAKVSFNSYFISQSNKSRTYASFAISKDADGDVIYTKYGLNSSLVGSEGSSDQNRNTVFQTYLNYDRVFGIHAVSGILLFNEDEFTISGDNFPVKHTNLSGRTTYAYNQKYIGEFSFSYMGSENFPKDERFGFFPAASVGWIVSNENFLKDNNIFNYLKIRGSYGLVGNDKIGGLDLRFMFDQVYPYTSPYYFGTSNDIQYSIIQGRLANPYVTWEKEKSANIGVEATILKRFNLTLDFFNRDRYDILVLPNRTDPDFIGYEKPYLNQGKANNKGFEGTLRYFSDKSNDFQFFAEASLWYFKNKIVYNSEALELYEYQYQTGRPINQPFGLVATGFFKDQVDIDASPKQIWTSVKPGDVKYQDQNNDGLIDQRDVYPIGKTDLPNLTAGLQVGAQYRGFDFNMFFQGVTNRTVYLNGHQFEAFQNNGKAGTIALNRWTPETAETATYPRLSSKNDLNNFRYSTLWQRDGSFIKLRSIELGYTLSDKISNRVMLANTRVFVNGTNLFTLDHMEGYRDPEISSGYPATRCLSLGLRVQFR